MWASVSCPIEVSPHTHASLLSPRPLRPQPGSAQHPLYAAACDPTSEHFGNHTLAVRLVQGAANSSAMGVPVPGPGQTWELVDVGLGAWQDPQQEKALWRWLIEVRCVFGHRLLGVVRIAKAQRSNVSEQTDGCVSSFRFGSHRLEQADGVCACPLPHHAQPSPFCDLLGAPQRQWLAGQLQRGTPALRLVASGSVPFGSMGYVTRQTGLPDVTCSWDDWDCYRPAQVRRLRSCFLLGIGGEKAVSFARRTTGTATGRRRCGSLFLPSSLGGKGGGLVCSGTADTAGAGAALRVSASFWKEPLSRLHVGKTGTGRCRCGLFLCVGVGAGRALLA